MNYRIVGTDGKVYGPVGQEQIRRWLAESRVESRTPVYVEGATAWTSLGLLPEFVTPLAGAPPAIGAVTATPASSRGTNGYATAGLICGLLAWTCCCCLPFNLLGIVFSIVALAQINSQPQPQEGRIFAIIGLVLSGANLLFTVAMVMLQMAFGSTTINWPTGQF
jgi:hypothetical protein